MSNFFSLRKETKNFPNLSLLPVSAVWSPVVQLGSFLLGWWSEE